MNDTSQAAQQTTGPSDKMGARFIAAGLLTETQVARVVELQNSAGIRFGEAAVRLNYLTEQNVQMVLSAQFNYATALLPRDNLDKSLAIAHSPFSMESEAIRQIRAELSIRLAGQGKIAFALVSPNEKEGKSYLAASLALAFSQMGRRTLLIDANLRAPRQHELFGLDNKDGLSTVLAGRSQFSRGQDAPGFPHLRVLCAGPTPPNPLEILLQPALSNLIDKLAQEVDVIIVDTPAATTSSDAQSIVQQVGACLLIGRQHFTKLEELRQAETQIGTTGAQVVGTIYNQFSDETVPANGNKYWHYLKKWLSGPRQK
ncbi:polysaccharide biosynthesis tyrosine autokinase [Herbaspirillum chlorophenolicum]|jgi:chain length determinant protein tyrosine kinase EpsG|uniref:polysaccharide biosynthesis tyrosine autokinase n=1 Tax=Herbaspirillum chlorophenolicum TaxID=211589 RepID=UPI00067BF1B3|nr:polysaccharide biosynthesis tyrosine autokinase [Herbaspirillum chlorophenolicum]